MVNSKPTRAAMMAATYAGILQRAGVTVVQHPVLPKNDANKSGGVDWWQICINQINKPNSK
jgi:hypothetical protein